MGVHFDELPGAPQEFSVWPENWETVNAFLRVSTQWRFHMGGIAGLDYTAMFHVFDLYGIKDKQEIFEGVQTMEAAVLKKLSERANG